MKNQRRVLTAIATMIAAGSTFATIPNSEEPKTYLGTILHGTYADLFSDTAQYAFNVEAGVNQQRFGAAGGYKADKYQRFKVYVENLRQNLGYAFFSGDTHQWVNQTAVDFRYEYRYVDNKFIPDVELAGYLAHAPDITLREVTGTYTPGGIVTPFTNTRRLAGAFSTGLVADFGLKLWSGNKTGVGINYDNIRYDMEYENNTDSAGLGGGLFMTQIFKDFFIFSANADWRQPFNYYAFNAGFTNIQSKGTWTLGGEWNYVRGKDTLPSSFTVGLFVNYWPETCNDKKLGDRMEKDDLLRWIQQPAVVMPQVLQITDQITT